MEILNDFTTSVEKALTEIDANWRLYNGLVVCGTHDPKNIDLTIEQIKKARENSIPFLGICMGFQLMLIEWVRSMEHPGANSAEIDPNATPKVIAQLPAMRVGIRPVYWRGRESMESHWHGYAFARKHAGYFEKEWELSWTDGVLEVAKLRSHPFFLGVQFHPEYSSAKGNFHPILVEFLSICKKYAKRN